MLGLEQRHHDQRVVAARRCARSRAAGLPRRSPRCVQRLRARVAAPSRRARSGARRRSRKAICLSSRTQARPRPWPLGCSTMRLSSTERCGLRQPCRITKPARCVAGAGLDDEVAEVGEAHRAFVLRALPGRDERQVRRVLLDRDDEVQVRQHRRPQPHRHGGGAQRSWRRSHIDLDRRRRAVPSARGAPAPRPCPSAWSATSAVAAKSSAPKLTGSRRRVSGLSVVSHSCSAFISPRPLKRLMLQVPSRAPSLRSLSSVASSSPSSSA